MKITKSDIEKMKTITSSIFERINKCPASWTLSKDLPPLPPSKDSERGERLHLATENLIKKKLGLDFSEFSLLDCPEIEYSIKASDKVLELIEEDGLAEFHFEERMYYPSEGNCLLSGKFDFMGVSEDGSTIHVIDFKFGNIPVAPAWKNLQLMCYAFLTEDLFSRVERIKVSIIAPCMLKNEDRFSTAFYEKSDFEILRKNIIDVLDRAYNNKAEENDYAREIGEFCKYCPAMAICKKQNKNAMDIVNMDKNAQIQQRVITEITVDNALEVYNMLEDWNKKKLQAEKHIDAIKYQFEKYCEQSKDERFEKKTGAIMKEYDVQAVFSYFQNLLSPEMFLKFCKPSLTKIFKEVSKLSGVSEKTGRITLPVKTANSWTRY